MSAALRSVGLLDAPSSAPPGPSVATPCIHARLHRLATDAGEKCGLGTHYSARIRRGAAALLLLLIAACLAVRPEAALGLGGPWPIEVSVEGEVRRPGTYALPPDATLSSLLLAAGGATDNADLGGAALFRASARASQESELSRAAEEIARETGGLAAGEGVAPILAFLRGLFPSGRIPVRVTFPRLMKNSPDDLRLEGGDVLRIPPRTVAVAVAGAVRSPTDNVPFLSGAPLEEYVRRAGGFSGDADRERVYLLRTDGTAALLTPGRISWNRAASRWEVTALTSAVPAVGPGDAIVVSRTLPTGLPRKAARRIPAILMRAIEIAGKPVVPPEAP
jgi:protein involved in polysaccharide export with SLBB domain